MDVKDMDDEYVMLAQLAMEGLSEGHVPGRYWVEYFPVLQHIPRWFPGTGFRKVAEKFRPYVENMTFKPFDDVIQAMVSAFTSIYPATSFMSVALSSKKGTLVHLWRAH